jgi:Kef-type K+ transport system membrane component KefB
MSSLTDLQVTVAAVAGSALNEHKLLFFLLQLGGLLVLALLFGRLATRLGMPAVVGELLVGVLIGPSVLGHLPPHLSGWLPQSDPQQLVLLEVIGQVGLLLLVGLTGAHIDLGLVRKRNTTALRVSAFGLVIPLGLGVTTGLLLPSELVASDRTTFALFLGVAMCVCAIPVIAKILMDMKLQHRDVGQLILVTAVIDDTVGWLLLAVVSAMATVGLSAGSVALTVTSLALILIFTVTVGRPLVRGVMRGAQRSSEPAVVVVCAAVVLIVLFAAGTHAMRFEPVLGAFLCGLLISSSGVPARLLAPLRTVVGAVFAPVFFAMAGLRMDLTLLVQPTVLVAGLVVLAIAIIGKLFGAYLGARLSRLGHWEALALGSGLNARGVIEVIVATVGVKLGVLNTAAYTIVILVAIVTSLMAPPMLRFAMNRVESTAEERLRLDAETGRSDGLPVR